MTYPKTGSTLAFPDGKNKTSTGISTNILITVGNVTVGAVQSLSITENRNITMINEIGCDGSIDSVPTKSTEISGTIDRIRFDRMRLTEAMGRGYVHIAAQRIPFDIVIIDTWYGDGDKSLITTIKNVWFDNLSYSVQSSDWIMQDKAGWKAESIHSTLGSDGQAATGGENGIQITRDPIEQATDRGVYRGSLSQGSLLDAILDV
jgi:hypothetical protein